MMFRGQRSRRGSPSGKESKRTMSYVLSRIEAMRGYTPGEQPKDNGRVIKLNTNENPYPPSPYAALAIQEELNRGREPGDALRLYPDPVSSALREAAAEVCRFPVEGILAGNGSDELLKHLFCACVEAGAEVAWPYPTYSLYAVLARMCGAVARTFDFPPDFRLPRELFGNRAKLTLVASPN